MTLEAPFPYFGGKSRVAGEVWKRFGKAKVYIEPFCGSLAMLLYKETPATYEIVNDVDGLLVNFWRSIQKDATKVCEYALAPSTEVDLQARHNYVTQNKGSLLGKMQIDPNHYDPEMAGYWLYVKGSMIGGRDMFQRDIGSRVPNLSRPKGMFSLGRLDALEEVLKTLQTRLLKVRISSGDWGRVLTTTPLKKAGTPTAIFLDPPYLAGGWDPGAYQEGKCVFSDVREWAIKHGEDPDLRISLCGYDNVKMPPNWETFSWTTGGGLGKLDKTGKGRGKVNRGRETIWFSPHCLNPEEDTETPFWEEI